jgi:hypothetical protein
MSGKVLQKNGVKAQITQMPSHRRQQLIMKILLLMIVLATQMSYGMKRDLLPLSKIDK